MGCIKNCSIVELYDNVLLKYVSKGENTFTPNCTFSGILPNVSQNSGSGTHHLDHKLSDIQMGPEKADSSEI